MGNSHAGFAVVDVETTGVRKSDRVIEIGVVTLNHHFRVVDEYETLIDPGRDIGPTHIHGITPSMVSMAPSFAEAAMAIAKRIEHKVVVAHNLVFDQRMLRQEFERLAAVFDPGAGICTLKLTKQKLPTACAMLGVEPPQHHRALADARASAGILKTLAPAVDMTPININGLSGELSVRTHRRCADQSTLIFDRLISRVVYDEADMAILQYMDLLDWVLDDLIVTEDERKHMNFLAEELQLSSEDVSLAHERYFAAMVAGAEKDGIVTEEEHAALESVALALGISTARVPAVSDAYCGSAELPEGAKICFTGSFADVDGNPISKKELASLAEQCGFKTVDSVTKSNCDAVVAVDPNSASGKAKKARAYGKPVIAVEQFWRIVQP